MDIKVSESVETVEIGSSAGTRIISFYGDDLARTVADLEAKRRVRRQDHGCWFLPHHSMSDARRNRSRAL